MKKLILYILLLLFFNQIYAQKMGYVDTQLILKQLPQYQKSEERLNSEVKKWQNEIVNKQSKLDKLRTEYENEKVLLTEEQRKTKIAAIDSTEKVLNDYIEKKFGTNGESTSLRYNLIKPLQDKIWNAINTLAAKDRYNFIFDKSSDLIMVFTDSKYDLTDKVIKQLGGISLDSEKDSKPVRGSGKNSTSSKQENPVMDPKNSGNKKTPSQSKSGYGSKYVPKKKQNAKQESKEDESLDTNESSTAEDEDNQVNEVEDTKAKSGYGSKYVPKKAETKKTEVKTEAVKKTSENVTKSNNASTKEKAVSSTEKKTTTSDSKSAYGSKYVPKKKEVKKTDAKKVEEKTEDTESVKESIKDTEEVETKKTATTETKTKSGYGSKYVPKKKKQENN